MICLFFINCGTLYVFASSTNQNSKQHGFETSNDFEKDNQKYSKQTKDIKRFGSLCTFLKYFFIGVKDYSTMSMVC
jgi:hypothetical protein